MAFFNSAVGVLQTLGRSDADRLRLHHFYHRAAHLEFHGDPNHNGSLSDPDHCRDRSN